MSDISKTTFYTTALGVLGASMLVGVRRVYSKENARFARAQMPAAMVVGKAFFWGTVLCMGTASVILAGFVATTGIDNAKDFGIAANAVGKKLFKLPEKTVEEDAESKEIEQSIVQFFEPKDPSKSK